MKKISLAILSLFLFSFLSMPMVFAQDSSKCKFETYDPRTGVSKDCFEKVPTPSLDIPTLVNNIVNMALPALGGIAVLFIAINGLLLVVHSGEEAKIKEAEKGIKWAALGLLGVIVSYALVKTVIFLVYKIIGA